MKSYSFAVKMMGCRTRQQTFYPDIQFLLRAVVNFGTSKSYSIEKLSKLAVVVPLHVADGVEGVGHLWS